MLKAAHAYYMDNRGETKKVGGILKKLELFMRNNSVLNFEYSITLKHAFSFLQIRLFSTLEKVPFQGDELQPQT